MGNPKIVAVISGIAAIFLSYSIFGPSDEAPSSTLNLLNWVLGISRVSSSAMDPASI